jgi:signal transduction histidine kinase
MGNVASVAIFCATYGGALLIFDPATRIALEAVAFTSLSFMGPFFLAFGLDYTGRGNLIRTPLFGIVAIVPLLAVIVVATNPAHQLVWTDFQIAPVFGLATAEYTVQPWGVFFLLFSIGTAAVGSLLLIGAVLSYGPLYRHEAIAVVLSTVPPTVGVSVWLLELGPVPQLHLTAPLMLIHVSLDAYAFVGTHMFETNPATQRMAEQTGLDSLSDPVFILDTEQQIVRVNDRAEALFSSTLSNTLPISLNTVLGVELETLREDGEIRLEMERDRTFAVSYTGLSDPSGTSVGSMLLLYDVTEDRQREQQLAVLNRVLRHNLRNETTVIGGYADLLENALSDPERAAQAGKIEDASDRLLAIAEKVRTFEEIQKRDRQPADLDVSTVLREVTQSGFPAHSDATIEWTVTPSELQLRTDSVLLSVVLENIVENAIIHSKASEQTVNINVSRASDTDGDVVFEIRDGNERIPEIEIETLREGDETPLQHGRGIGLWIVYWCIQKLHGRIDFEYDDGNVLVVTLPDLQAE